MTAAEMKYPVPAQEMPAARHLGLRVVLIIAAVFEAFDGLSSFPTLFGDMSEIPGPGFGGFLIKAHIATHLPLAWPRWYSRRSGACDTPSSRSAPWLR